MLTCREVTELVTDHVEGRTGARDGERFERHVGGCAACREYVRQMDPTRSLVGRMPSAPIPAEVRRGLLSGFRDWRDAGVDRSP